MTGSDEKVRSQVPPAPETGGDRLERGDLIVLVTASLDGVDPAGRLLPDRATATARVVRSPEGEVVAYTRLTATPGGPADPAPGISPHHLQRAAQEMADRIIGRFRRLLDGEDENEVHEGPPRGAKGPSKSEASFLPGAPGAQEGR